VLEGGGFICSKVPRSILPAEVGEGVGELHIVVDESLIEVGESQEGLDFMDVVGFWPQLDCQDLHQIHV
jgi:hypothetical protein